MNKTERDELRRIAEGARDAHHHWHKMSSPFIRRVGPVTVLALLDEIDDRADAEDLERERDQLRLEIERLEIENRAYSVRIENDARRIEAWKAAAELQLRQVQHLWISGELSDCGNEDECHCDHCIVVTSLVNGTTVKSARALEKS